MILIRPAASDPATETDPRLSPDWTGNVILLSPAATLEKYREAVTTAAGHRLPLVIPRLSRRDYGQVVIRIAQLAPELGLAAVVVTHGWEPCTARATFTPLTLRQRLRTTRLARRRRPGRTH